MQLAKEHGNLKAFSARKWEKTVPEAVEVQVDRRRRSASRFLPFFFDLSHAPCCVVEVKNPTQPLDWLNESVQGLAARASANEGV